VSFLPCPFCRGKIALRCVSFLPVLSALEILRPRHQKGFIIEGRPAGRGRLDIPRILARLRALGQDPNAILALWPSPEADTAAAAAKEAIWAAESVSYLRELIPD
jgi:hypothetical protein